MQLGGLDPFGRSGGRLRGEVRGSRLEEFLALLAVIVGLLHRPWLRMLGEERCHSD